MIASFTWSPLRSDPRASPALLTLYRAAWSVAVTTFFVASSRIVRGSHANLLPVAGSIVPDPLRRPVPRSLSYFAHHACSCGRERISRRIDTQPRPDTDELVFNGSIHFIPQFELLVEAPLPFRDRLRVSCLTLPLPLLLGRSGDWRSVSLSFYPHSVPIALEGLSGVDSHASS